jgi:hypothetical protein
MIPDNNNNNNNNNNEKKFTDSNEIENDEELPEIVNKRLEQVLKDFGLSTFSSKMAIEYLKVIIHNFFSIYII